jgi:serine/threonine-protein kinase
MRELVRALALEPTNRQHVAMLASTLEHAPTTVPTEVARQVAADAHDVVRGGVWYSALAMVAWFAFLPLVLLIGIRRMDYFVAAVAMVAVSALIAWFASRQPRIGRSLQYALIVSVSLAGVCVSRIVGPLVLIPTLFATWTVVGQAHPERVVRRVLLAVFLFVPVLTVGLELVGVLPASYSFEGGRMTVLPQLSYLPELPLTGLLTIANLLLALVPAVFVGILREQLTRAQTRQLVQTWHFRRLGDDLIRAAA